MTPSPSHKHPGGEQELGRERSTPERLQGRELLGGGEGRRKAFRTLGVASRGAGDQPLCPFVPFFLFLLSAATSEEEVNMWIKGLNWLVADTLRAATPLQIERWGACPCAVLVLFSLLHPLRCCSHPGAPCWGQTCTAARGRWCPQQPGWAMRSPSPRGCGDLVLLCEGLHPIDLPSYGICGPAGPDLVPLLSGGSGSSSTRWIVTGRTGKNGEKTLICTHVCTSKPHLTQCQRPRV